MALDMKSVMRHQVQSQTVTMPSVAVTPTIASVRQQVITLPACTIVNPCFC